MKILFFGDSLTDAFRNREDVNTNDRFGCGFVAQVAGRLLLEDPTGYEIINRGIGGNRSIDLYARIKTDVWNHAPDVLNIFVGVNDLWHELAVQNCVEIDRFERIYTAMIEETKARLPDTKMILCEPFVCHGFATNEIFDELNGVREYAAVVRSLAEKYGLPFLRLQDKFEEGEKKYGEGVLTVDGVHPTIAGAAIIAEEWLKLFREIKE